MTPEQILDIPLTAPFELFPLDRDARKIKYRELAIKWHPDHPGGRDDVFAHINALHDACDKPINVLTFDKKGGGQYKLQYLRLHTFELGTMAVGRGQVGFIIDRKHDDLVISGLRAIGSIRYPDKKLETQHRPFVPMVERVRETADNKDIIIVPKDPGALLLRDILSHTGTLGPKHVTWIISSLLNLVCFYEVVGLTHNGLSVDTVFISPAQHTTFPAGGWWYAKPVGEKLRFLPPHSHSIAPVAVLKSKQADHRIDLECIRSIARVCLGNPTGGSLSSLPKPFADFLRLPAPMSPREDYARWEEVRKQSWGPRRFLPLDIKAADIYR